MTTKKKRRQKAEPREAHKSWNEAELSDFWMGEILKSEGWGTRPEETKHFRKEVKSSARDRLDIALYINDRVVSCIELKSPKDVDLKDLTQKKLCLSQASNYALSKMRYYHGAIVSPLGVLTNGFDTYVFDGSLRFESVLNFHKHFDLRDPNQHKTFVDLFSKEHWDEKNRHTTLSIGKLPIERTQKPPYAQARVALLKRRSPID